MPCAACSAPDAENACSGCRMVRYRGKECEASHWRAHKAACKAARAVPPAPPRIPL